MSAASPSTKFTDDDARHMRRALELAARGEGWVEPNPMVGAVIVRNGEVVGEGWHRKFGDLHAEAEALKVAGERARGGTIYVTLEPCSHVGKQPPCADAVIAAGIKRVVAATQDPSPKVCGTGFNRLQAVGIQVDVGLLEDEALALIAPFRKLSLTGQPWVIAKWAMTLDGKIATRTGNSKWISGDASRALVQQLRGRVDAIVVGRRTVELDDPLLTARLPPGESPPRVATRIVLDSHASIPLTSQLVKSLDQAPLLVATSADADADRIKQLTSAGIDVFVCTTPTPTDRINDLLTELGRRQMTNVLVEGGSQVLGAFFDAGKVDEVHAFIAPKLVGGTAAPSPAGGLGSETIAEALNFSPWQIRSVGDDILLTCRRQTTPPSP